MKAALRALAVGALAVAAVLAADRLAGGRLLLRASHALQARLAQWAFAATLDVPGAGAVRMFLHPEDAVITRTILATGLWEPNETHWFVKSVREGDVVVDVGANVGYYTLIASRLVGPTGRVYAFEPDPTAFAILERNVRLNGAENVVLERKALSNAPGTLRFFLADENKGDHRIYQPQGESRPSIAVEAVRLDDYLRGRSERVDFVKVDTQGAESVILEGMEATVRANDGILLAMEFWPSGLAGLGSDAAALLARLRALDFRFYNLGPGGGGPGNMGEIDEATLLSTHTLANRTFTNLLCVKGWTRTREGERADRLLARDAPAPGR